MKEDMGMEPQNLHLRIKTVALKGEAEISMLILILKMNLIHTLRHQTIINYKTQESIQDNLITLVS